MSSEHKNPNIVIPFCIFHYMDPDTNTYHGFIANPSKIKTQDGHEILKCLSVHDNYGPWKLYGSFYALSPMIRPIPSGLKLMNANIMGKFPYNTKNVKYAYDPFDVQPKSVSFLTWSKAVQDTVPLYLHITPDGGSYPSFDSKPPQKEGWTEDIISPLYVLVDPNNFLSGVDANSHAFSEYDRDEHDRPDFKFSPVDGRCLPDPNGMSLAKCFLITDENVLGGGQATFHSTLLRQLKKEQEDEDTLDIGKFFRKLHPILIILFTVLFLTSLIACIVILTQKEK